MSQRYIQIINARQHNLKGVDVNIPLNKITVITGPSGSGKSSLGMDVLFAEGQHRYLESLGFDAAYILKLWDKPDVDAIKNLPPSIAIEQNYKARNPNSTIASITGLDDIIKLLFVHSGTPHCTGCNRPVKTMNIDDMVEFIENTSMNNRINLMTPLKSSKDINELIKILKKEGFSRIVINNEMINLDKTKPDIKQGESVFLLIDRMQVSPENRSRLTDSISSGLKVGNGVIAFRNFEDNDAENIFLTEKNICPYCNIVFPEISSKLFSKEYGDNLCRQCFGKDNKCEVCDGSGIGEFALNILLNHFNFPAFLSLSFEGIITFFEKFQKKDPASLRIIDIIKNRINTMIELHLGYISLNRSVVSLSRGELQRLRLGIQLGKDITGILYILDEPTVGLHSREQASLWTNIVKLREQGNTVLIIEHNLDFIKKSDFIIELGPSAGEKGGRVIYQGDYEGLLKNPDSVTAPYLLGSAGFSRKNRDKFLKILTFEKLNKNNLKIEGLGVPLNSFVCVCGVSGSGKTTLVFDEMYERIKENRFSIYGGKSPEIFNVIPVDQLPISSSSASMVATYLGIFDPIRSLFAKTNDAKTRGVTGGYFSLNKKGGRCEECSGQGYKTTQLGFLPPVKTLCSRCLGLRYSKDALDIRYKGKNMAEILQMDIATGREFFLRFSDVRTPLETLEKLGLYYLKLGQITSSLSGGEAQRLKLARELYKTKEGLSTIFLLDEPTQGLHAVDIEPLLDLIDKLLGLGHSVIMIEHHEDILKLADWVIELGEKGGEQGGKVVFEGKQR